jgi:hypothetical protein
MNTTAPPKAIRHFSANESGHSLRNLNDLSQIRFHVICISQQRLPPVALAFVVI